MTTPDEARDMLDRAQVDGDLGLTAEMAARAPFMAEQIANMHYEYAVQVLSEGEWHHEHENHGLVPREGAQWFDNYREAWQASTCWVDDDFPTRIVRRLATDPEVVE